MLLPWHKQVKLILKPHELSVHVGSDVQHFTLSANPTIETLWMKEIAEHLIQYQSRFKSSSVKIVLSNHFIHYAALQWKGDFVKASDWRAIAINHFRELYGPAAARYQTQIAMQGYGKPVLACAVDQVLIEHLDLQAKTYQWQQFEVVPAFFELANQYSDKLDKNAWFLVDEKDYLLLGQAINGAWQRFSVAMPPQGLYKKYAQQMVIQVVQLSQQGNHEKLYTINDLELNPSDLGVLTIEVLGKKSLSTTASLVKGEVA